MLWVDRITELGVVSYDSRNSDRSLLCNALTSTLLTFTLQNRQRVAKVISQYERYAFLGELRVKTYRNLFRNEVPTGINVFRSLKRMHEGGKSHEMSFLLKIIKIHDFSISNSNYAEILFQMTDPGIPDNVLSDRVSGDLRIAARHSTEDPAVSAHVVVNLSNDYDNARLYPACIENIDYLPKTLIMNYFNQWIAQNLTDKKIRGGEKEARIYRPVLEFVAPASQTIQEALDRGGVLRGVKWVEDKMEQNAFGDKAYPVEERKDVALIVKNGPTGDMAKKILKGLWNRARGHQPKSIKVTIEDNNSRTKVVTLDPNLNNVLANVFIPQVYFDNFEPPLAMCEAKPRADLLSKMRRALK